MVTLTDQLLLGGSNAGIGGQAGGWVGYYTDDGQPPTSLAATVIANSNTAGNVNTAVQTVVGQNLTTLALDANTNGHGDGNPYLYAWPWDGSQNTTAATAAVLQEGLGQTQAYNKSILDTTTARPVYMPIYRWTSGDMAPMVAAVPTPNYFEPTIAAGALTATTGWSGGEVIQSTGEIFFGGTECTGLNASYRMMIWNPETGDYNYSGLIQPATPADDIFGTAQSCSGPGYVASDMALDGNGNAYILVVSTRAVPSMGVNNTGPRVIWLVRVVPSETTGGWKYNLVAPIFKAPNEVAASAAGYWAGNGTAANQANLYTTYGMAFMGGALYAAVHYNGARVPTIVAVNPMSGQATSLPSGTGQAATPGYIEDLASGQTAFVLQGTVYNDSHADGVIDASEAATANALSGIQVALYQKTADGQYVLQGQRFTDAAGGYSFLLGGKGDYIVRVVRPQVDGINAVQTWASGGGALNTATAVCTNGNVATTVAIGSKGGRCDGAVAMPTIDAPLPANPVYGTENTTQPNAMPIHTLVHVESNDVVTADFGVTAVGSFGDAAAGPASVAGDAPMHINGAFPQVWLGAELGTYDGPTIDEHAHDSTNDGLYVGGSPKIGSVPIQSSGVLAGGRVYTMRTDVSGPQAADAQVNGWATPVNTNNWSTTPVWNPTVTPGTTPGTYVAVGGFQPATATSTGEEQLRAQVTLGEAPKQPTNSDHEYQDIDGTMPWATPGEIEDYHFQVAPIVYRSAVVANGAPITGPVTVTPDPTNTTSAQPEKFTNITFMPKIGGGVGVKGAAPHSMTVEVPHGVTVLAQVFDTETGAVTFTPKVTNPTGPTATVTWGPMAINDDATVLLTFVSPPDPGKSTLECTPDGPLTANGTDAYICTATVEDANGARLPEQPVAFWSQDGNVLEFSDSMCTTDGTGSCAVDVKVTATMAGTWHVNASVDTTMEGGPVTDSNWVEIKYSPTPVTFEAGPVDLANSTITIDNPNYLDVTAAAPGNQHTVTVKLFDANMNPVLSAMAADIAAVCPADTTCSAPAGFGGVYTFKVTTTKAGSYPIQATYKGGTIGATTPANLQTVQANFKAGDPVPPGPIECPDGITITANTVLANPASDVPVSDPDGDGSALSAYVVDEYCNPIPGAQVSFNNGTPIGFAVVDGANLYTNGTTGLAAGGKVTDPVVEAVGVAGSYLYPEMDASNTPTGTTLGGTLAPATVAFKEGGFSPSMSTFVVAPSADPNDTSMTNWVTADGSSAYTGTVTARDTMGNLLTTLDPAAFQYTITGAPSGASVLIAQQTTDGNGHYYVKFTTTYAASTYKVTASYGGGQIVGAPTVVPGAPMPFQAGNAVGPGPDCTSPVVRPKSHTTITTVPPTTPPTTPAGTAANVDAFVTDEFCNPVANVMVIFTPTGQAFMGATPSTLNATVQTDSTGHATTLVNDYKAELVTVTTTSGSTVTGQAAVTFTAGEPTPCTVPGECDCTVSGGTATNLSANPMTVQLQGLEAGTSTIT
ncbi:MAG: Ig-like domain-containing protein, partial [Propionibacteriaceae bacterium]|nr:Ig-like domain-containing protein [Propionibacteriaceae bacterium]